MGCGDSSEDIEVTDEMIYAGWEFYPVDTYMDEYIARSIARIYRAMRMVDIKRVQAEPCDSSVPNKRN